MSLEDLSSQSHNDQLLDNANQINKAQLKDCESASENDMGADDSGDEPQDDDSIQHDKEPDRLDI